MFSNKYRITRKIAQGGMAEVYCAVQRNVMGFQKTVAIKKILPKHVGSTYYEELLVQEAKLLVTLNHPNIVKVYDLGSIQGAYFFVMEYVEGCDLRRLIQWYREQGREFPIENIVLIMTDLCKALAYAHAKTDASGNPLALVHQDVSPKNILLSHAGEVKLTDFGIASFREKMDSMVTGESGRVVRGKYSYMSPEQSLGLELDNRSDIFSLGLVFYELLAGQRFYKSRSLVELQKEHEKRRAQAPLFDLRIPVELEYIVLKCLAHEPQDRYAGCDEIHEDLVRFLFHFLGTIPNQQLGFLMEEVMLAINPANAEQAESQALGFEGETLTRVSSVPLSHMDSVI